MWLAYQPPHFMSFTILNIYMNCQPSCCFFFVLITWLKCFLLLLCFPGFVELNHMLTSCYPPLSANSTYGPLRLLLKQRRERERERWPSQGHRLLDVLKLWNSERICTSLVSPRTFFFCTHIHTSFPTKPCLNDSYLFWTTKKLLLEQWEKQSKRNYLQWPTPPNS